MSDALAAPTLVLNRNWVPVDVTTVRRALVLLFRRVARVVKPEDFSDHDFTSWAGMGVSRGEPCIHTVTLSIRVPEVILLLRYGARPRTVVAFSRKNIFLRDGYTCQYCGARPGTEELSIDHVLPRSRGGKTTWENCVLACMVCNSRKASRTLDESGLALIRQPERPRWAPHLTLAIGRRKISWEHFVSDKYWNVELQD